MQAMPICCGYVDEFFKISVGTRRRRLQGSAATGYQQKYEFHAHILPKARPRYLPPLGGIEQIAWRIAAARRLLEETDDLLSDIATATGFFDQSHMTRAFKAMRDLTPGEYRRHRAQTEA